MVAAFPPPVMGASTMSLRIADRLARNTAVVRADVGSRPSGKARYHLVRMWRHISAAVRVFRSRSQCGTAYFSLPAGWALLYLPVVVGVARAARYRIVLHHHSFRYLDKRSLPLRLVLGVAGPAQTHLVLCQRMGDALRDRYPSVRRVSLLSNAWAIESPACAEDVRDTGPLTIGHLSNLTIDKGLDTVIAAHREMIGDGLDVVLRLAGPFANDVAAEMVGAAVAANRGRVVHVGPLDEVERARFLASVDVFVFPTRYANEAEPLVVDEALAAGCSVVVTRRGCLCPDDYRDAVAVLSRDAVAAEVAHAIRLLEPIDRELARLEFARRAEVGETQMKAFEEWLRRT